VTWVEWVDDRREIHTVCVCVHTIELKSWTQLYPLISMIYEAASETAKSQGEQRKILLLFRCMWDSVQYSCLYSFTITNSWLNAFQKLNR
jgi:hypothetical protein